MPALVPEIVLSPEEEKKSTDIVNAYTSEKRMIDRCRIILLSAMGLQNQRISKITGMAERIVSKGRTRYAKYGFESLKDAPRLRKPTKVTHDIRLKIIDIALYSSREPAQGTHH